MVLERLSDVPWDRLVHAYGSAADVPALVRALQSPDDRVAALAELFGCIWHQGTVYEATVFAIPFLIELLRSPDTPEPADIALLLAYTGSGRGYLQVHAAGPGEAAWRAILAKTGQSLEAELEREHAVVSRIRTQIADVLDVLVPYLAHGQPEIRAGIGALMASFPEERERFVPMLQRALSSEADEDTREALEQSLGELIQSS